VGFKILLKVDSEEGYKAICGYTIIQVLLGPRDMSTRARTDRHLWTDWFTGANARLMWERLALTTAGLLLTSATAVAAAADPSKPPQWYEVVTGVLAIPVTLIGLAYSYLLIKKTRLEAHQTELDSRKTELEILEKERELAQLGAEPRTGDEPRTIFSTAVATIPGHQNRLILLLLLRFVVLSLIISGWGVVEDTLNVVFAGAIIGAQSLWPHLPQWVPFPIMILEKLPRIAYWIVFFSLAWPLFKDANAALGINIKNFFSVSSLREMNKKLEVDDS
jgi:hypothetical protein